MGEHPKGPVKISVRGVERHFGADAATSVHALGPFDLDVGEGEFVCVVGPSGCGKSTLLRMVAGLLRPSKGEIELYAGAGAETPVAMVFQDYSIYPWKTVERNVSFGLELRGVSKREAVERGRYWLDRLGLSDFAKAYPDTLSGGMRQRVSIARALSVEPEILLMDEPFAALDAQLRQVLQDELLEIWQSEERRTVLFITHSLEEAIVLGDRVVVMSARPGVLVESVDVPFERPRTPELRARSEFNDFKNELWQLLKGEVANYLDQVRSEGAKEASASPSSSDAEPIGGGSV
ncbi:MAG: NitT/TauT family transport system ATP-binding protein [Candidatus Aldehydirespiratoraceae bacterium]